MKTIGQCLASLELSPDDFNECLDLKAEFLKIKKEYYNKALKTHPDKGGDAETFQTIQASFEILREIYDTCQDETFSFATSAKKKTNFAKAFRDFKKRPTPSYDYYSKATEAAQSEVPLYRVEPARSGRGSCQAKGIGKKCPVDDPTIEKDEVRIGSFNAQSGSYGRWCHLSCWRVPMKIWLGLPSPEEYSDQPHLFDKALLGMNEVSLSGYSDLKRPDRNEVVQHVVDRQHWARATSRKPALAAAASTARGKKAIGTAAGAGAGGSSSSLVPSTPTLSIPEPGQEADPNSLSGKKFVLTGRFPEVGGGFGLREGKDNTKTVIESFGGKVVGSISGKTDVLVVGEEPGFKKVLEARERNIPMVHLSDLVQEGIVEGNLEALEDEAETTPMKIDTFSPGFSNMSHWQQITPEDYAIASGHATPRQLKALSTPARPRKKKAKTATADEKKKQKRKLSSVKKALWEEDTQGKAPPIASKKKRKRTA
jgi:hypothetical protein